MTDKSTQKSRPARDRAATEARLLEAGRLLFANNGYAETSLDAIAGMAGVNKSLIVRYFGGKSGLLAAITANTLSDQAQETLPYPPQETLGAELLAYLRHRFKEDQSQIESIRLFTGRLLVDPEFKHQMQQLIGAPDQNFSERLDALVASGSIDAKALDPDLLFRTVCVFSTGVNFTAHHLLGVPKEACDAMFQLFSQSMDAKFRREDR